MEPIALTIQFLDGTSKTVEAVASDLIAFETHFDMSIAKLDPPRLTHLFFLAWHSDKRTGGTKDDFEKWVETVSVVSQAEPKK